MALSSEKYKDQLKALHSEQKNFGEGLVTAKHYPFIEEILRKKKLTSILDYGCGKGHFIKTFNNSFPDVSITGFDIANPEYEEFPNQQTFDLVVSLDVLEHVEFGSLGDVLSQIKKCTGKLFICSIANYPARKILPDGRNAHVTQMTFSEWMSILSTFFRIERFQRTGKGEGIFICTPLKESADWR
jgi:2-polyprenyl-3-methyl-5-hydroxy-6-metoxy-1,4-benzoquinol methylase